MSPNAHNHSPKNGSRHPSTSSANSKESYSDRSSSPTANDDTTNNQNEKNCDIIVDVTNSDANSRSKRINKNIDNFFTSTTSKWTSKNESSKKYHSIKNRLRNETQVGRSKSFQEQDIKPHSRYSRFFSSRHHDDMSLAQYNRFSAETVSHHNIEITIEDTELTNSRSCSCQRLLTDSPVLSSHIQNRKDSLTVPTTRKPYKLNMESVRNVRSGHILGRIFRRMRKITSGWRKSRCKTRRGLYLLFCCCCSCFLFESLILLR